MARKPYTPPEPISAEQLAECHRMIALDEIKRLPRNPNVGDRESLDASLDRFGWFQGIVIADGVIVAGNHRVEAARARGVTHLPGYDLTGFDLSAADRMGMALADNYTNRAGRNDPERLADALVKIGTVDRGLADVAGIRQLDPDTARLIDVDRVRRVKPRGRRPDVPPPETHGTVTWLTGDVLERLADIPDGSVDLVATSPPFLGLRDYNGVPGQWGSEPTPAEFLENLLHLTVELRRVLAPHGTIAIELGDKLSGGSATGGDDSGSSRYPKGRSTVDAPTRGNAGARQVKAAGDGWPLPKSLCVTPALYAASIAYGRNLLAPDQQVDPWIVRNLIVWARNNPPVGSLADKFRPATSYITVAATSPDRWMDPEAVRQVTDRRPSRGTSMGNGRTTPHRDAKRRADVDDGGVAWDPDAGAPPLDYWTDDYTDGDMAWLVNTGGGSSLAHFAMWPAKLAKRLILAFCPHQVCRQCGEPRRRLTESEYIPHGDPARQNAEDRVAAAAASGGLMNRTAQGMTHGRATKVTTTVGWSDCGHDDYRTGVVLDTFAGTGTTLAVADLLGRDSIGIDLDPANQGLFADRYAECARALGIDPPG